VSPFKDLAELHVAAVESGQTDMFKTILNSVRWASSLSPPLRGDDDDDTPQPKRLEVVKFAERPTPAPREFVVEGFIPRYHPTTFYGWGGTTKSIQAMLLAMCVAGGRPAWLNIPLHVHGPTLYLDFELEADEQQRRVEQLAAGMNIAIPPHLNYISALGFSSQEAFAYAQEVCKEQGVVLAVIDSLGPAMFGDMGSARDVITFHSTYIAPFRALGVTPLLIDHQARQQAGESYQNKGAFGSAYKEHLSRSLIQIEGGGKGAEENVLTVRVRHKKTNFSALRDPFEVQITFSKDTITTEARELDSEDLSAEQTLNSTERVVQALKGGPAFPTEIEDKTGLALGTVKNVLTRLKKQGRVKETGERDKTGAHQVQLVVPNQPDEKPVKKTELSEKRSEDPPEVSSLSSGYRGSDDDDTSRELAPRLITDPAGVDEVVNEIKTSSVVAIDLETTGLSPVEDKVRLLSSHAGRKTFLIDAFKVDPSLVLEILRNKTLYVHGAEFDLPFLHHQYGFEPPENVIDTLHLSQVARAGEWKEKADGGWERERHSLKDALERELGLGLLTDKKEFQRGKVWSGDLTDEHLEYAAGDVIHLKALADKLLSLVEKRDLNEVWELERRAKPLFLDMCIRGIPLDKGRWEKLTGELEDKIVYLKEKVDELAPPHPEKGTWNWNSPKQAKEAFSLAGLKVPDLQRETLLKHDHPLIKAVAEYRDTQSLLSRVRTWAEGRYRDGRVYPQWKPAGAATGRASCTTPNVQSLPKGGHFRGCIRPGEGRVLVTADLSQIELRVLAAITEDENMLEVFRNGGDIHLNTARALAGRNVHKGDPERQKAKAVNFGLSFGMGAKRFRDTAERDYGVEMSLAEAKEAKRKLLDAYPKIAHWHAQESQECERGNFATKTLMGRRRVVEPDRRGKPSFTERLNAPVQGTAADILKLALARLWESREEHPGALPILSVHDEMVLECDEEDAEVAVQWLNDTLREAVKVVLGHPELAGPDVVATSVVGSWGEV
jgi:DNA polymerase-1